MNEDASRTERSKVVRILCTVLWFIPIDILVGILVGAIFDGIAGSSTQSHNNGYAVGRIAAVAFSLNHSTLFLLGEVALTVWLSYTGILPGTSKWKKA